MPSPAYVNAGAVSTSGAATSRSPSLPSSRANGNMLIAVCRSGNNAAHTWTGTGWQKFDQVDAAAGSTASLAYCIVDGTETAPGCSWTGSVACGAIIYQFSGTDGVSPFAGAHASNTGITSTHSNAGVNTTRGDSLMVYIDAAAANTALAQPTGWTERSDTGSIIADTRLAMGTMSVATLGAASGSISVTGANAPWVMWQIELLVKPTAAVTGTAIVSINEADIVAGGKTIIVTLTNDTWVTAGATFDAQRQAIINGIDSAQAEASGWDAVVKATQGVSGVVRTSDTVVTITLDAQATYDITATETITVTVPSVALTGAGGAVVAAPAIAITYTGGGGGTVIPVFMNQYRQRWA